jgi:hypothetical protein
MLWTAVRSPRPGWLSGLLATAGAYGHWFSFRNADYTSKWPLGKHCGVKQDLSALPGDALAFANAQRGRRFGTALDSQVQRAHYQDRPVGLKLGGKLSDGTESCRRGLAPAVSS